jgi:hypothetical protein
MPNNSRWSAEASPDMESSGPEVCTPYVAPRLELLGNVANLTKGGGLVGTDGTTST